MNGVFALGLLLAAVQLTVNWKRGKQIDNLNSQIRNKEKQIANLGSKIQELNELLNTYERREQR